jgi:hypothetical protein
VKVWQVADGHEKIEPVHTVSLDSEVTSMKITNEVLFTLSKNNIETFQVNVSNILSLTHTVG